MKRLYQAAAVLVAASAIPQISQAGVIWGFNNHEYELVNAEGSTWTGANAAATSSGWSLATITSSAENTFVVSNLLQGLSLAQRSHYWLGGTDGALEGTFAWVTGEAFGGYTNWWSGEPNNANNEDFIAYDLREATWRWNDAADNLATVYGFARGYIMEREARVQSVPEPTSIALLGLGLLGAAFARRKRV